MEHGKKNALNYKCLKCLKLSMPEIKEQRAES